ncbi:MAG: thioredoxin family protein [Pirellulaceae bacterium]|nr:thioredoxin family protein [Pirellulaceae bacterium]
MTAIILTAMVQVLALGADPQDFDQACRQSLATQRPLVVLVGANWCAACQIMQKSILPEVEKGGGLNRVVFIYVDFDRQRQLASRLTGGGSIPQLIRFDHTQAGWANKRLIGAKSPGEVNSFVNAGLIDEGGQTTNIERKAPRQSALDSDASGPVLTKAKENHPRTDAKSSESSAIARSQHNPRNSASNKTTTAAPPVSQPWAVAPVNPPVGQQRAAEPYHPEKTGHTEKTGKPSERTPFFKRFFHNFKKHFQNNENRHNKTTY